MPTRRKESGETSGYKVSYGMTTVEFVARGKLCFCIIYCGVLYYTILYYTLDFRPRFIKYERERAVKVMDAVGLS